MLETSVSSDAISKIRYDPDSWDLEVTFRDGSVYTYVSVPLDVYIEFADAPSKGGYFNAKIRNEYGY